jgi:hypothetical protein
MPLKGAAPFTLPSTVGGVDQVLQPFGQFVRVAGGPGVIDQADVEHVAEVHAVFVAIRREFHSHQCLQ